MVTINGKEYDVVLKNWQVKEFGNSVGANNPMEAMGKLSILSEGNTFEAQEITAKLLHFSIGGKESIEVCFEFIEDITVIEELLKAVDSYIRTKVPADLLAEVEKKKAVKEAV
jgi:hypothetical protein